MTKKQDVWGPIWHSVAHSVSLVVSKMPWWVWVFLAIVVVARVLAGLTRKG